MDYNLMAPSDYRSRNPYQPYQYQQSKLNVHPCPRRGPAIFFDSSSQRGGPNESTAALTFLRLTSLPESSPTGPNTSSIPSAGFLSSFLSANSRRARWSATRLDRSGSLDFLSFLRSGLISVAHSFYGNTLAGRWQGFPQVIQAHTVCHHPSARSGGSVSRRARQDPTVFRTFRCSSWRASMLSPASSASSSKDLSNSRLASSSSTIAIAAWTICDVV